MIRLLDLWRFVLRYGWVVACGVLLCYGLQITRGPVNDFDSRTYHGWAAWALGDARAWIDPSFNLQHALPRYPFMWEGLVGGLARLTNGAGAARVPNLIAWLLLGFAVWRVAVQLGADVAAPWAALLMMSSPTVLRQVGGLRVDVPMAAFFMLGLYAIARVWQGGGRGVCALALISIAAMPAVKASGLVYGALAGGLLVVSLRHHCPPHLLRVAIPVALAVIPFAGWWYAKNLWETGRILHLAPQYGGFHSTVFGIFDFRAAGDYRLFGHLLRCEFGLPGLVILMGCAILGCIGLIRRHWWVRRRVLCSAAGAAFLFVLYTVTPLTGSNGNQGWHLTAWAGQGLRMAIPALAVATVCVAVGTQALCGKRATIPVRHGATGGRLALKLIACF